MLSVGGLFDGCGLLALGLCLAGLEHRWLCEVDPFRRELLARRWPGVRIYDDVRAVGHGAEPVTVIAGGFPCKGGSTAGRRQGFGHPETRLWYEMARAVGELRPRFVLIENVANLLAIHDGAVWGTVLGDLAALGYDCQWDCIPAAAFGAAHLRDRVIAIAADPDQGGWGAGPELPAWPSGTPGIDWPLPDRNGQDAADSKGEHRQARAPAGGSLGRAACGGSTTPADPRERGQQERPAKHGAEAAGPYAHALGRGVRVEWGPYGPAIRRWEAVHGPAPEPLVRRVDDRSAARVERSRLSALGDGVQVQLGMLAGAYLASLDRERAAA